MNILVLGGTRFFGIHLVKCLLSRGDHVTIATRGNIKAPFGDEVESIIIERSTELSIKNALRGKYYDVIYDNLVYSSNDIKYLLDNINCKQYIITSTTSVYDKHLNTVEEDFNPRIGDVIWCSGSEYDYSKRKRYAEMALFQKYESQKAIAVRFPFVIGQDDYTNRLYFYVEHVVKKKPMYIENVNCQMGFVRSDEAGKFLAYLSKTDFTGSINGSSIGTISIKAILDYVIQETNIEPMLSESGEKAPYNGERDYSISTERAQQLGFEFSDLKGWIYGLLDHYITKAKLD